MNQLVENITICVNWYIYKFIASPLGYPDIQDVSTINSKPGDHDVLTNNLTVTVKSISQDENQDTPILYVLCGVAGGVIFVSIVVLIIVIIFKRSVSLYVFLSIFMLS